MNLNDAAVQGGWFDQYMARDRISDPSDLPSPSPMHVKVWRKEFLELSYPPRFTKSRMTKDDEDVWAVLNARYMQLQYFYSMLEVAYVEYTRYKLDIAKVNAVCANMRAATQIKAWKNYWERTTNIRRRANQELKDIIANVGIEVDNLFEPLVVIKRKEYDNWARLHPQSAANIALKKRLEKAEQQAADARKRAEDAEYSAISAMSEAAHARFRAQTAEQEAQAARQEAQESKSRTW